jgi:hypothetical protein
LVLTDVIYANGKFVAVGTQSSFTNAIIVASNNGVDWVTTYSNATAGLALAAYHNGIYYVAGAGQGSANTGFVISSSDGENWLAPAFKTGTGGVNNSAIVNDRIFFYTSTSRLVEYDVGIISDRQINPASTASYTSIASSGDQIVASGNTGFSVRSIPAAGTPFISSNHYMRIK